MKYKLFFLLILISIIPTRLVCMESGVTLISLIAEARQRAPSFYTQGSETDAELWVNRMANDVASFAQFAGEQTTTRMQLEKKFREVVETNNGIFKINLEGITEEAENLYDRIVAQMQCVLNEKN